MGKSVYLSLLLIYLSSCAIVTKDRSPKKAKPAVSFVAKSPTLNRQSRRLPPRVVNCASQIPQNCMACALQGEAANQPTRGIYAVGVTIMTRAYGSVKRICKVTKAHRQFEGMRKKGVRKISGRIWQVTEQIMKHRETGWTHFWAPKAQARLKRRKPAWARAYEKRQCKKEKIGDHVFYNKNQCYGVKVRKLASDDDF